MRRSSRTNRPADRGDRFWPVDLLIWLFAGSLGGFVVVAADFRAPRTIVAQGWASLLASGWAQLAGVVALLVLMTFAARWLRRAIRRRVQVCVLLSLVVHCWMAVFLYAQYLPVVRVWGMDPSRAAGDEAVFTSVPEYPWERVEGLPALQDFERPVPAEAPGPSGQAKIDPKPLPYEAPVQAPSLAQEPPPPPREKPEPQTLPMARLVAPQPEDAARQLARQESLQRLDPPSPIPEPAIKPPEPEVRPEPAPRALVPERQAADFSPLSPATVAPALDPRLARTAASLAQRETDWQPDAEVLQRPGLPERLPLPRRPASRWVLPVDAADADAPGQSTPVEENQPGVPPLEARSIAVARASTAPTRIGDRTPGSPTSLLPTGSPSPPPYAAAERRQGRDLPGREEGIEAGPRAFPGAGRSPGLPGLPAAAQETPLPRVPAAGRESPGQLEAGRLADMIGPNRELGGLPRAMASLSGTSGSRLPGVLGGTRAPPARISSDGAASDQGAFGAPPARSGIQKRGERLPIQVTVRDSPTPSFRQRDPGRRGPGAKALGGTQEGEDAVQRGVDFLARHQFPDGHWSLDRLPAGRAAEPDSFGLGGMNGDTAATGLALLTFLGAGYTHLDGKHEATVRRGIEWLLRNQQPDGRLFTPQTDQNRFTKFYGHAIGSIVLCEAYGMTADPNLREPAQQAVRFICTAQDAVTGGWRYEARSESDTSVSGWKLMALKSAQMAGLEVPAEVFRHVARWLDAAQADGGSRYAYNPRAPDTDQEREGRRANLPMTAEGLLMRMYLGWERDNAALTKGARYLLENLPGVPAAENPPRDVYYWYYATQVMFQLQGDAWQTWNGRLRPMLEQSQLRSGPLAGSWDPKRPVRDRWEHAGGRIYVTALCLLMLEAPYRHLPLYRSGQ